MTTYAKFGLSALFTVGLLTPGCSLIGVEPDEIDLADESGTGSLTGTTNESSNSNGGDGDGDSGATDTGDGDPSTTDPGDGDGDSGDGDGDAGDGDAGDGDGDGDGDRDTGDGDGDGDAGDESCELLDPPAVEETANEIDIPDVMSSFDGVCGSPGPDAVFSFTATSDATYEFTLVSDDLEVSLYLVAGCDPLDLIECEFEGQSISHAMLVGEVVYIIVDSATGPGAATLTIAAI